jgi:hypothetical protein
MSTGSLLRSTTFVLSLVQSQVYQGHVKTDLDGTLGQFLDELAQSFVAGDSKGLSAAAVSAELGTQRTRILVATEGYKHAETTAVDSQDRGIRSMLDPIHQDGTELEPSVPTPDDTRQTGSGCVPMPLSLRIADLEPRCRNLDWL